MAQHGDLQRLPGVTAGARGPSSDGRDRGARPTRHHRSLGRNRSPHPLPSSHVAGRLAGRALRLVGAAHPPDRGRAAGAGRRRQTHGDGARLPGGNGGRGDRGGTERPATDPVAPLERHGDAPRFVRWAKRCTAISRAERCRGAGGPGLRGDLRGTGAARPCGAHDHAPRGLVGLCPHRAPSVRGQERRHPQWLSLGALAGRAVDHGAQLLQSRRLRRGHASQRELAAVGTLHAGRLPDARPAHRLAQVRRARGEAHRQAGAGAGRPGGAWHSGGAGEGALGVPGAVLQRPWGGGGDGACEPSPVRRCRRPRRR